MEFALVKGEFCSCSCNFVSDSVENRSEERQMTKKQVSRNLGVQLYL